MNKRTFCLLLALLPLLPSCPAYAAAQQDRLSPFVRTRSYENAFSDLPPDSWYAPYAAALYEYGLCEGRADGRFSPADSITVAELLTFSARLRAQYDGEDAAALFSAEAEDAWYQPYLRYLLSKELLADEYAERTAQTASRADMAGILFPALPEDWYDGRNADTVTEGYARRQFIPDVDAYTLNQSQILWLYRQGIVCGTDALGSFCPDAPITRAEVSAILVRMLDPATRITLSWQVLSYQTAEGTRWGDLVTPSTAVLPAVEPTDTAAVDAAIRSMLYQEKKSITLNYPSAISSAQVSALAHVFTVGVKRYCEQMYNKVTCHSYSTGRVVLDFCSTVCDDSELDAARTETLRSAIALHDALWDSGYLSEDMNEYDLAKAYFVWLCENCSYDSSTSLSDRSESHMAYNVFRSGIAVCDGYTGAYNLLLKLEGIDCTALFNDSHIWTVATLDGMPYHIDTTWGDQGGRTNFSFFAMSAEASRTLHPW